MPATLIVPGDAATTVNNIKASESLFRLGFVSGLITQTVQILLVLVLYQLLKPVNKKHALLMVIFALVGIPIAMLNLLNQSVALLLLSGAGYLTVFTADQLHAQVIYFLICKNMAFLLPVYFGVFGYFPSGF